MKRIVPILIVTAVALVLWTYLSSRSPVAKQTSESLLRTNQIVKHATTHRTQRAIVSQTDSTETPTGAEDAEVKKLSREQIDAYLLKTKRSPENLLNAFQETGDTNFLAEAVKDHSDNPLVQWTMLNQEISQEERAQWLGKLKASSPNNALPNYLSALDDFKAGEAEQALAEIDSASKKKLSAYEKERMQSAEEMYLLSGSSPLEAKVKSSGTLGLSNLSEMKQLSQLIGDLQQKYKSAGDAGSNQQLAAVGVEISRKYSEPDSPFLVNQLVGMAMENITLKNLDAETYYDFLGKTAGERIQEIKNQKQEMKDMAKTFTQSYLALSEAEKMIYMNRRMLYGEMNAWRWLDQTYGSETK